MCAQFKICKLFLVIETSDDFVDRVTKILDYRISPLFTPIDGLLELPRTYIYVCEHDVLKDDGVLMYKQMVDIGHTGNG